MKYRLAFLMGILLIAVPLVAQPSAFSVSPNQIAAGSASTEVSIAGANFISGHPIVARLGSEALITSRVSNTEIRATIPNLWLVSPTFLSLTVYDDSTKTSSGILSIAVYSRELPVVTAVTQTIQARGTGTRVTVTGANLVGSYPVFDAAGFDVYSPLIDGREIKGTDSSITFLLGVPLGVSVGNHSFTFSKPTGSTSQCGGAPCVLQVVDGGVWQNLPLSLPPGVLDKSSTSPTVLADGRVLIAGGQERTLPGPGGLQTRITASTYIFDPSDSSTQTMRPMNIPRYGHRTLLLSDGRVAAFGGFITGGATSSVEIFDPNSNVWTNAGFVRNTSVQPVLLPSGKVLLLPDEVYDPTTFSETRINGVPRGAAGIVLPDGKVYVAYPTNPPVQFPINPSPLSASIYDPVTDAARDLSVISPTVQTGGDLPLLSITPAGQIVVASSFMRDNQPAQQIVIYDRDKDRYTLVPITIVGPAKVLSSGKVFVYGFAYSTVGGALSKTDEAWTYDPATAAILPAMIFDGTVPPTELLDDSSLITNDLFRMEIYTPPMTAYPSPVLTAASVFDRQSNGNITMAISGVNFVPSSVVRYGATRLTKIFTSGQQLFAFVPGALAAAKPNQTITVTNAATLGNNPVPSLSAISPSSVVAGSTDLRITLEGIGFIPDSMVRIGSTTLPSNFGNSSIISVTIPSSIIASPGSLSLTVVNPAPGGGISQPQTFVVNHKAAPTGDFDADGKSDISVFRPSTGMWWIEQSKTNYTTYDAIQWGWSDDIPVAGDYDGDSKTDLAVYRPSSGTWWILQSSANYSMSSYVWHQWGVSGDIPAPGDYDGDGKADVTVYRPSTGEWWILKSSTNFTDYVVYQWGQSGDTPTPGDYDGDGKTDIAVFRPSGGTWWILRSSTNFAASTFLSYQWGMSGDLPVTGDYDGDGLTDIAVYRPSNATWWVLLSTTNFLPYHWFQWGLTGDLPVAGDFDGDGKSDIAVYRPSTGTWWVLRSSTNFATSAYLWFQWGITADVPVLQRR